TMNYVMGVMVILLGSALAYGGEIRVRVSNARGGAVAGARVMITTMARRGVPEVRKEGDTGPDGAHLLTGLEAGSYRVVVFVPSEQLSLRGTVALRSNSSSIEVDFRLPPAAQPPRSGNE
ncbi:MAG: carboxypeptidase-like regulatory domain-containing protein, partial [Terriglobia bacterium]